MNTRDCFGSSSFSSRIASQFGAQLWLIQRASLPSRPPSITQSSFSVNRKVWPLSASPLSPASTSSWVRRRPVLGASGALAFAVVVGVVLALFQPWKLWVDETVDQAAPEGATVVVAAAGTPPSASGATPGAVPAAVPDAAEPAVPATTAAPAPTRFVSLDHSTSGGLTVLRGGDGAVYVRFEDLRTDNGPDLKVYLSTNPVDGPEGAFDDDAVDLGRLQGNIGSQNYLVPAGTDLTRFRSVVIWCDRFNAAFGAAPLA